MMNYSSSWNQMGGNHVQITFFYGPQGNANAGKPVRLVFNVWNTMRHLTHFEFKDLPLP